VITVGGRASNGPVISVGGGAGGMLTRLGGADTAGGNVNATIAGDLAYVCGEGGVSIVNVSNPSQPQFVNLSNLGTGLCRAFGASTLIARRGGNPSSLSVLSLANPTQLTRLAGPFNTPQNFIGDFYLTGTQGFFATVWFEFFTQQPLRIFRQHGELFSVSFSNPAQPAVLNTLAANPNDPATSNESPFFGVLGIGNDTLLLMSTTNTLENTSSGLGRIVVIDISNPASLRAVRQILMPRTNMLHCAAASGSTALVVGNTQSWTSPGDFAIRGNVTLSTFDLSDPRNPRSIATVVTNAQNTFTGPSCVSLGGGFFAFSASLPPGVAGENRIVLVDARDPNNPTIAGNVSLRDLVEQGLTVSSDRLYAATSSGLTVYQISR
jgi:hypothetical protein